MSPSPIRRARWKRVVRAIGLGAALGLAGLYLFVMLFEDRFIYVPTPAPPEGWDVARLPFPCEDVAVTSADGVRLHGWYARGAGASWTILHLHGNAGNVSHRTDLVARLVKLPADVLIVDWRGYGRSEGTPSEEGLYADARAAYDYLTVERGVPAARIAIHGESLGAAPAIELAGRAPCGRLIVQSAFTSITEMSGRVIPLIPVGWMMRHRYDNLAKVPGLTVPKLHIHSREDEIVPFDQGRRLFEAAAAPKEFYVVEAGGHNELPWIEGERFEGRLRAFLGDAPAP